MQFNIVPGDQRVAVNRFGNGKGGRQPQAGGQDRQNAGMAKFHGMVLMPVNIRNMPAKDKRRSSQWPRIKI